MRVSNLWPILPPCHCRWNRCTSLAVTTCKSCSANRRPGRHRETINVQRCFTSTETVRTVRDGEPTRTATSTFTQLLNSELQPVHWYFTSTETVRRLLGTGSPGPRPPRPSHSSWTLNYSQFKFSVALRPETVRISCPAKAAHSNERVGRPPRLSHGFWALKSFCIVTLWTMLFYVHRNHTDY